MKYKTKPKPVLCNVPVIMTFRDYHEINYVRDYFNELMAGKKLKSKELPTYGEYAAIFYFKQDAEFKAMVKEYKRLNEEEYD
jgi:hypothetical protein